MSPRSLAVFGAVALLLACRPVPGPDPQALALLDGAPLPEGWAPHATVMLSTALVEAELARQVEAGLGAPVETRARLMGVEVQATVRAREAEVRLRPPPCEPCLTLQVEIRGGLELSAAGSALAETTWVARLRPTLQVGLDHRGEGSLLVMDPVDPDAWPVDVQFERAPSMLRPLLENAVTSALQREIRANELSRQVQLARLPPDVEPRLRGLRVHGGEGVRVEMAFATLRHGLAPALPVDEGFGVAMPAETLLGVVEAALVRMGPVRGWRARPRHLELRGGRYALEVEVRRGRGPERSFRVEGPVAVDHEGGLVLTPDLVRGLDRRAARHEARLKHELVSALDGLRPLRAAPAALRRSGRSAGVARVEAEDDRLLLWGEVR